MNEENIAKLIAALRSNEYDQATQALRSDDQFCCLGVACDISGLGTWKKAEGAVLKDRQYRYVVRDENGEIDSAHAVMPDAVARWLGIDTTGELVLPVEITNNGIHWDTEEWNYPTSPDISLTELNDSGMTFSQIADILENANTFTWKPAPVIHCDDE